MKKIILSILLALLVFVGGKTAFAQTPGQTNNASTTKAGLLQKIKNVVQNTIQEKKASTTIKVIENRFTNMARRYTTVINRESAIITKIESRIAKIKETGVDTTEADSLIAQAKIQMTEATNAFNTLNTTVTNIGDTTVTKETLNSMRNSVKTIDKYLREGHRFLLNTVGSLRGVSQLRSASSTKSN